MTLNALDGRLLCVFDELYKTRSVSRTADALGLGQPTVSISLGKLRTLFADPLFVRTAKGMEPTPYCEALIGPVRDAVEALDRVLGQRLEFDPASSARTFRVCMTDISQLVLLPALWTYLRRIAPGVHIEVLPLSGDTATLLEDGGADLAIGFMPQLGAGFYQQTLFNQQYVCMVSAGHPRIRDGLSREQFEEEEHAMVSTLGTGHLIVDQELARQGIVRRVALRIPNFVGLAFVIEKTDLIITIPRRLGEVLAGRGQFRCFPVPYRLPEFAVKQHWHERFHRDPGNRWLRGLIAELLSEAGLAAADAQPTATADG